MQIYLFIYETSEVFTLCNMILFTKKKVFSVFIVCLTGI